MTASRESSDLPEGTVVSDRFEAIHLLGRGGMASVYRAHDHKLNRPVALKLLAEDVSESVGAGRFRREIEVVGNLSHPHILPLHDSGEWNGRLYYVMPLAAGQSLRELLRREGPLPADRAVQLGAEVADALAHAHSRGVIHRDVTPGNILVVEGHAVLCDFGIALGGQVSSTVTGTGLAVGTPAYMSPEQSAGERALDGRSDCYSLACVMWEMLTGEPPFCGPTAQAIIARHLVAPVPSLRAIAPSLPASLESAIARALAKDPDARYGAALEFRDALIATRSDPAIRVAVRSTANSLVVLPFGNMSQEADSDWFSDGLTTEIISVLSRVTALRVISHTSAMRLKGTARPLKEIGREMGARLALEGSVRRAGSQVRITAHLVETETERSIWSDRFAGTLDDVFDIQESIARRIAEALTLTLSPAEARGLGARPIGNVQAFDHYLRARHEVLTLTPEALRRALGLLERARELGGESDVLLAAEGLLLVWALDQGVTTDQAVLDRARMCADRALARNENSALAHALSAAIAFKQGRIGDAVTATGRALALDSNNADTLMFGSMTYVVCGRIAEARVLAQRLLMVDPLNPVAHCMPGYVEWSAGNIALALPPYEAWYSMDPRNPFAALCYGHLLFMNGRGSDAQARFAEAQRLAPESVWANLAGFFSAACEPRFPIPAISEEAVRFARSEPAYAIWVAFGYAAIKDEESTLAWLRAADRVGFANAQAITAAGAPFQFLAGNAEYERLLAGYTARARQFAAAWETLPID